MKNWLKFPITLCMSMISFLIIMMLLLFNYILIKNELNMIMEWELLNMKGLILNIPILFDKISITFSMTVLTIFLSVMFFSTSYMSKDKELEYFIIMVSLFVLSMNLLIFFPHMISLLLGWDGLGFTSYLLVIYYMNDKSLGAGMLTMMTNRIGDALLIIAASWALMSGHWNLIFSSYAISSCLVVMISLAAMTKSAQMPFSAWLPAAMAAPTPVSALVHSSTLVTAGIYLIIRFFPTLSIFNYFQETCFYVGVMTCLMASMAASVETDLKKIIALSTLSQLGVMVMSLGLNQPMLAFFHLITHALFKALLFICAGNIIHNNLHNQDIRLMGNLSLYMPLTCSALNIANISLCGLPFMAGFYSKDLIIETFITSHTSNLMSVLMVLSVCLTSAYSMKLSYITLWTPFKGIPVFSNLERSKFNLLPYGILMVGAILSGASTSWWINTPVEPLMTPLSLKLMTLTLIFMFGVIMYLITSLNWMILFTYFLSSMWFLSFISAPTPSNKVFKLGSILSYNETTWMEHISGKGLKVFYSKTLLSSQKLSNMSLSKMMSVFTMMTMMVVMYY